MSDYSTRRQQVWMLQVRRKGSNQIWSCTGARYFYSRAEVISYIATEIWEENFKYLEYRPSRYMPAKEQQ